MLCLPASQGTLVSSMQWCFICLTMKSKIQEERYAKTPNKIYDQSNGRAAAQHAYAAKCSAAGDHDKAKKHAKNAEDHCTKAQDHSKRATAA